MDLTEGIEYYKNFRLNKLNTEKYRHVNYLFYWLIYGILFFAVERLWIRESYTPMYCVLDDYIPFCEYFLIPYLFWFIFLTGAIIYTFFCDVVAFKRMMRFIVISYSIAIITYIIFPNCQLLRPHVFERDNILTRIMAGFYQFDTNTNVCPSVHVIGSMAVVFGVWNTKRFGTKKWRIAFAAMGILISISTVFLKQHSVIDVAVAVPVCFVAYWGAMRSEKHVKAQAI